MEGRINQNVHTNTISTSRYYNILVVYVNKPRNRGNEQRVDIFPQDSVSVHLVSHSPAHTFMPWSNYILFFSFCFSPVTVTSQIWAYIRPSVTSLWIINKIAFYEVFFRKVVILHILKIQEKLKWHDVLVNASLKKSPFNRFWLFSQKS